MHTKELDVLFMQALLGILLPDKINIERRSTLFNAAANVLDAAQSMLLFIAVTRICSAAEGGVFSISMAVAYQMVVIGRYGMRDFQATDIHGDFTFSTYFLSRIVTTLFMCTFIAGYIVFNGYSLEKASIMIAVCLYKAVDVWEDVYHGYYQRNGRLDGAALSQTIRCGSSIALYITILLITKDLFLSTCISALYAMLVFVLLNKALRTAFSAPAFLHGQWAAVRKLLISCAPLGLCAALALFAINYPKYAIDSYLNDLSQTYYGALSMPVFAANLFSISIYRPILLHMARHWHSAQQPKLKQMIRRQLLFIAAITALSLILGYLWGIPVLSFVYGIDLKEYRPALLILLAGGGMAAISGFMTSVISVMRLQKYLIPGYAAALLVSVIAAALLMQRAGVDGASITFAVSMLVLALMTGAVVFCAVARIGFSKEGAE